MEKEIIDPDTLVLFPVVNAPMLDGIDFINTCPSTQVWAHFTVITRIVMCGTSLLRIWSAINWFIGFHPPKIPSRSMSVPMRTVGRPILS